MSKKFDKNRSVSTAYIKIPMYYTGIKHPTNKNKELVLMDRIGKNYSACWRNNKKNTVGIEFLILATKTGFIFKDKEISLSNCNKVF
jgi:hypothetical protein